MKRNCEVYLREGEGPSERHRDVSGYLVNDAGILILHRNEEERVKRTLAVYAHGIWTHLVFDDIPKDIL